MNPPSGTSNFYINNTIIHILSKQDNRTLVGQEMHCLLKTKVSEVERIYLCTDGESDTIAYTIVGCGLNAEVLE